MCMDICKSLNVWVFILAVKLDNYDNFMCANFSNFCIKVFVHTAEKASVVLNIV